eukprot:3025587-Prymnesium_polylepis.1
MDANARPSRATKAARNHTHHKGVYTRASETTFSSVCVSVPSSPTTRSSTTNQAFEMAPSAKPKAPNRTVRGASCGCASAIADDRSFS